ncbi:hypothetical protein BU24DRAFT_426089 [Aaosphaeria arxii CBS 175.79]|uniref:Uncharacterized protein n=1 Tax=Aaosphaeria arxii CBS 175.79 TaxID=1450172 RepID=A0A6A5XHI6_9PLEO|nr:uncharacterized protein BU24DRAFT_426089 [Aaosphaeria arxii CBS 175.79]KAF2012240.1 hypothetical protein BU24DRAFT_426089 [Aaosphaeria arxii CBS 175.79]
MTTHDTLPTHAFMNGYHPSSPPITPGSRTHSRYPPQTSHTSPLYKNMGIASPPLEYIEPIGHGPQFHFRRPPSKDRSSQPSVASGLAHAATPEETEDEYDSDDESVYEVPARLVDRPDFVLEEFDSDSDDDDIEVLRPYQCEDARSEKSGGKLEENGFLNKFMEMNCQVGSSDEEEQERSYRRKKKRWSAGVFKRSHSQSVEGESSYSDNDPLDDVDLTARRLRRRVRGPGDRRESLVFIDRGFSNSNNIMEVEEPDEHGIPHTRGPPSIPSDDGFTLDELPFWFADEPVLIESSSESSDESS